MTQFRPRGAVAPLRRPAAAAGLRAAAARRTTVDAAVASLRPEEPLHCLRPRRSPTPRAPSSPPSRATCSTP